MSRLPACRSWFPLNSNEGNDGSFLFYPWTFLKEETTSKKTSKLLYYFLSLCKTFNELFHLPPPLRSGHTRPCFPKASAKVQPFNVNTKRFANFFRANPDTRTHKHNHMDKKHAVKHVFNTNTNHAKKILAAPSRGGQLLSSKAQMAYLTTFFTC